MSTGVLLPESEIPQADNLADVLATVRAVATGARRDDEIARAIGKVARQGRYYRLAAEILGLLGRPARNESVLTPRARALLDAPDEEQRPLLTQCLLSARLFQRLVPFLQAKGPAGCTTEEIASFMAAVIHGGEASVVERRAHTVVRWLGDSGLVETRGARVRLLALPQAWDVTQTVQQGEPLLPAAFELHEYEVASRGAREHRAYIEHESGAQEHERSDRAHESLVRLVALKIRAAGAVPRANALVDLAARVNGRPFLFEMKSTTHSNEREQLRRGLAQLYEYGYVYGPPDALLVLVLQRRLRERVRWLEGYLVHDRRVIPVWDGKGQTLSCPDEAHREVAFLVA